MRYFASWRACVLIGTMLGGLFPFAQVMFGQEQSVDWGVLDLAARRYVECPSTDNALLLYNALPEMPLSGQVDEGRLVGFVDYAFDNIDVLERQVSVGDRNAVKLGLRLYNFAGGLNVMRLDCMMGNLARSHPRMFLEELKSAPNAQWIKKLGYPVDLSSFYFSEKWKAAHRFELEMRIKALESVTDNSLVELRDECIKKIKEFLAKVYHD